MMSRIFLILSLVLSANFAFAKPEKKSKPSSEMLATEREREFSIPVPQSEIKMEPLRYKAPRPVELSVGASSFAPENFVRGTYTGRAVAFEKGDLPSVSINRMGEIANLAGGMQVSSKIGVSYFAMERSVGRSIGVASAGNSTETMNFIMGRVGIESSWASLLPWGFEPNLSVAVLPTFITAHKSQFEDNVSSFGLPYEATAGLLWRAKGDRPAEFGDVSVGVFGQAVGGTVAGSNMKGLGVLGELRVSL
jgi:hypothetical protein